MKATQLLQFPEELKRSTRWVLWKYVPRNGKQTKLPFQVSGQPAESNNPATWCAFAEAIAASEAPGNNFEGVGCMISDPYVAVDFDHVRDPKTGEVETWAWEAIKRLNTYTELSPSGTGFHAWCYGKVSGSGKRKGRVELYASGRYFTATGLREPSLPATVNEIPDGFYGSVETLDPLHKAAPLLEARQGKPSGKNQFDLLMEGKIVEAGFTDPTGDSEADLALCGHLARLYNNDPRVIDWIFRQSGLMREKWEREDYRTSTIAKALKSEDGQNHKRELVVLRGDQQERTQTVYAWKPYLPLGKLIHFGGISSQAKSPVLVDLFARITASAQWPDGSLNELGARSVILLNEEDDYNEIILPHFDLAGGDDSKIYYIKATKVWEKENPVEVQFAFERDMQALASLARSIPDLGAVGFDPITNYLTSSKQMNGEVELRNILRPIASLAEELKILAITIGHLNRREKGTDPLHRMMGAAAMHGVARAVYVFGPDPAATSKYSHIMSPARNNGLASLKYHTATEDSPKHNIKEVVRVVWDGKSEASAEDAVDPVSRNEQGKYAEAAKSLRSFLSAGKKSVKECKDHLSNSGYADLDPWRIRKLAGIDTTGNGKASAWFIPEKDEQREMF